MSRARDLANSADNDISGTLTVDDITLSGNITVGGTVDGRDLATDGSKLDGVEANATADQTGAEIKAAYEGETDTNAYTDAEKTKLSGIETGATADQTITAGSGLTGGGTGDVTISHADTSSVSNSDNSGNTFIQDLTFDGYGHVTAVGTGTVSVGDGTLTVQGTGALGGSGTFTANQSANTTISISHDDTSSQSSVDNSGATVIQDVTLDGYGHVTGLGSKTMTLADLGYTGATNANYITNNNQLTNGAGYSTYSANQSLDTTSSPTFSNPNLTSALRMGGTQVLSSGRALTNITSVDSTTATAIGNAGVGGGLGAVQTSQTTTGSNLSSIDFSLGNHRLTTIIVSNMRHTNSSSNDEAYLRLKDSSSTLISGNEYHGYDTFYGYISDDTRVKVQTVTRADQASNIANSLLIHVWNAYDSSVHTFVQYEKVTAGFGQSGYGSFGMEYKERNAGIRLYTTTYPFVSGLEYAVYTWD